MSPAAQPSLEVERTLLARGFGAVIGCDEVGRGALAGPVTVGVALLAVPLSEGPEGLRDSKLLSAQHRQRLVAPISAWLAGHGLGSATAAEIDARGIVPALGVAALRALAELSQQRVLPGAGGGAGVVVLLDGAHDWLTPALSWNTDFPEGFPADLPLRVVVRPKADRDCQVVAAASVLAKVSRDAMMTAASEQYSGYEWQGNKGYGSAGHMAAIRRLGPSPIHRQGWLHRILDQGAEPRTNPIDWGNNG